MAEQLRASHQSERNLARRLRQAESAQAAAIEAERQSFSQAQRAEVAASLVKQGLLKAQAGLQENKTKLHLEQQKTAELQVSCKARLKSALLRCLKHRPKMNKHAQYAQGVRTCAAEIKQACQTTPTSLWLQTFVVVAKQLRIMFLLDLAL